MPEFGSVPVPDFGEPTRERLRLALEYLSTRRIGRYGAMDMVTVTEVRRTLAYHGVTGLRCDGERCPLAVFLSAAFGGRLVMVGVRTAAVFLDLYGPTSSETFNWTNGDRQVMAELPTSVSLFRQDFDAGYYPDLETES